MHSHSSHWNVARSGEHYSETADASRVHSGVTAQSQAFALLFTSMMKQKKEYRIHRL